MLSGFQNEIATVVNREGYIVFLIDYQHDEFLAAPGLSPDARVQRPGALFSNFLKPIPDTLNVDGGGATIRALSADNKPLLEFFLNIKHLRVSELGNWVLVIRSAGHPLEDPRMQIHLEDVARFLDMRQTTYDALLLDVDKGPEGLTRPRNDWVCNVDGLNAA